MGAWASCEGSLARWFETNPRPFDPLGMRALGRGTITRDSRAPPCSLFHWAEPDPLYVSAPTHGGLSWGLAYEGRARGLPGAEHPWDAVTQAPSSRDIDHALTSACRRGVLPLLVGAGGPSGLLRGAGPWRLPLSTAYSRVAEHLLEGFRRPSPPPTHRLLQEPAVILHPRAPSSWF